MAQKKANKKSGSVLWSVLLLLLCIGLLGEIVTDPENRLAALLALPFCVAGFVWQVKKIWPPKQKTDSTREENLVAARARIDGERAARAERAIGGSVTTTGRRHVYKLRGVTFEGRQKWLAKILEEEDPFTYPSYELEPYTWKGSPACRVLALPDDGSDPVDIGNIPAESAREVCALVGRVTSVDVEVYGGPAWDGDDKSYGVEVTITVR